MSSAAERQAADYRLGTPRCLATVTTANGQLIQLPSDMGPEDGHQVFAAEGLDIWIRFGDVNVQVDRTQVSSLTGDDITTDGAKVPHLYIPAGQERQPKIPAGATHFAHISTGTTGFLRFGPAQGQGTTST